VEVVEFTRYAQDFLNESSLLEKSEVVEVWRPLSFPVAQNE